jgi:hypothetical protein
VLEIGSSLREARSRCGLELADVEAATMTRARYLLAPWNLEARAGGTWLTAEPPTRTGDVTTGPSGIGPTA